MMRMKTGFARAARALGIFIGLSFIGLSANTGPASADAVADFYRGKKITLTIPAGPGGSYTIYARLLASHLGKHIPGTPEIITAHRPGGAGIKAANYIYNVAKKDGTEIAAMFSGIPTNQVLRPKSTRYDAAKLNWIGNLLKTTTVIGVWADSPATDIAGAKTTELRLASSSPTSETYTVPTLMNALLGTKFNVITGYQRIAKMGLAMERREVHGHASSWANWAITRADWLAKNQIRFLVQWGADNHPEVPAGVPQLLDLAKDDDSRSIIEFVTLTGEVGRPYVAPPGTPPARIAALRGAFDAMVKDPAFLADAKKRNMEIRPSSGAALDRVVAKILGTPKPISTKAAALMGFGAKRK